MSKQLELKVWLSLPYHDKIRYLNVYSKPSFDYDDVIIVLSEIFNEHDKR